MQGQLPALHIVCTLTVTPHNIKHFNGFLRRNNILQNIDNIKLQYIGNLKYRSDFYIGISFHKMKILAASQPCPGR